MPPKKKPAAKGYKLAESLPEGEIVEDMLKRRFKIGPSIGSGGFGMIYSAKEANSTSSKYPFVLKIEPHTNGPLFVESHFYMRNGKQEEVEAYKKNKELKFLGMPVCHAKGSHEYRGEKYRFLVIDKFGTDLWKLYLENNRHFPVDTVFKIGLQILDVLEYIHSKGYVHADIKAANILLGSTKETQNKQVYLVDFGLATKYSTAKEFKPDPKRAHDGTIEYLSRDAHKGVQTRRGDLEILAYNLTQWLGCVLPWEITGRDPKVVQKSKETHMSDIPKFLKACFEKRTPPKALVDFLNYLKTLDFNTEPNYAKIRKMFISGIKDAGGSLDSPLKFASSQSTPRKRKSPVANSSLPKKSRNKKPLKEVEELNEDSAIEEVEEADDSSEDEVIESPKGRKKQPARKKVLAQRNDDGSSNDDDEELATIPNKAPAKRVGRPKKSKDEVLNNSTDGMTAAMREIASKLKNGGNVTVRKPRTKVDNNVCVNGEMDGYTDSMKELALKKKTNKKTAKLNGNSESEQDELEGYTESMKELVYKKNQKLQPKTKR